jgi:hypothetical protein
MNMMESTVSTLDTVMGAAKFFPPALSPPLNGELWAIVGAETQVFSHSD